MIKQQAKAQHLFDERKKLVPNGQSIFHPSTGASAKNAIVVDADGRELIDFAGGIGVVNSGHCPEPVVKAIQEQAAQMIHACFAVTVHAPYLSLADELAALFPHSDTGTKVVLTNCGAEANENAIKFARMATGRSAVICFEAAFHGRTFMALSLTSKTALKKGCGTLAAEIYRLGFPFYGKKEKAMFNDEQSFADFHIKKLHDLFTYQVSAENVAAVIIELVQGEGGFSPVSKIYLQALRKITKEFGIMLIIDEVQSGFGRTCKWSAYEHYEVIPDISTWGKSIGGGMPVAAVMGNAAIMDGALPGTVGGTYLGNPVCVAAALANIRYMKQININKLAEQVAVTVRQKFDELQKKYDKYIYQVKGLGAMQALEFTTADGTPQTDLVKNIIEKCWEKGLIVISAGAFSNYIRMLSPLTIPQNQLDKGLSILEESIHEYCK